MQNVVVSVDEDGTVLISIPPGHLPLADMVRAALGHAAPPVEPQRAPVPTNGVRRAKALARQEEATARVVAWLKENGPATFAQILHGVVPPAPHQFKIRLQAMVKSGAVTTSGERRWRVYGAP